MAMSWFLVWHGYFGDGQRKHGIMWWQMKFILAMLYYALRDENGMSVRFSGISLKHVNELSFGLVGGCCCFLLFSVFMEHNAHGFYNKPELNHVNC